jgi:hypothetical protein
MTPTWTPPASLVEAAAREWHNATPTQRGPFPFRDGRGLRVDEPTPWEKQSEDYRAWLLDTHRALLADLRRPAARAAAVMVLAGRVQLDVSRGVWWVYSPARPPNSVASWRLQTPERVWYLCDYPADLEALLGPPMTRITSGMSVRNLPTDPVEALALMLSVTEPR